MKMKIIFSAFPNEGIAPRHFLSSSIRDFVKSPHSFLAILLLVVTTLVPPGIAMADPAPDGALVYKDKTAPAEARVQDLLRHMTLDEKIHMLGGTTVATPTIPRLGVPAFLMSVGPGGAHSGGPTTAYPAPIALAAAWNTQLAGRVGTSLGRDCRAAGIHILLGPGINLYRAPMAGRNFEYFGEDPVLTGQTAAAYICGVQSQGAAATIKHYAANNQDWSRHNLSSDVDETTLRELYLRAFQIGLREGQPRCLMTSYNPVNGVYASQNHFLIATVLRGEFHFTGLVMSDWNSCYDTLGMATAGLDLEMPVAVEFTAEKIRPLLDTGKITPALLDEKVCHLLRVAFEMGWFDRPQLDPSIARDDPASDATALEEAREGIVLLKNRDHLLPLDAAKVRQVAVVGPNAAHPVTGGGGSSWVQPFHAVTLVDGLKAAAGDPAKVVFVEWKLGMAPSKDTLRTLRESDAVVVNVGFDWPGVRNAGPDDMAGVSAKNFPPQSEGEGGDRTYALPPGSEELIKAVAAINPHTVVVLNAGGSVATAGWIDRAAALLHAFYPGQEGGRALGEIIFGQVNPSGKLPFSWEKRWEDSAAYGRFPDNDHPLVNDYAEGLLLGYRWFDAKNIQPLFPFGYGLSYTDFVLSKFKAAKNLANGQVVFQVNVRNTGHATGAEVVQVYVDVAATSHGDRPPRELKAYGKVFLQPGEQKTLTLSLNPADLATWDVAGQRWSPVGGTYTFQAGDSSRNLTLRTTLGL